MSGQLKASPEEIATFAKETESKEQDLRDRIVALKAQEDATTATWGGQARAAFDTFMEAYYVQAHKMNDKLGDTAEKLAKVGTNYESQDQEFASKVQAQASSLDLP
ncbi:WXG100 family type VII secretion target [Nocardia sp. NPDC058176]|uniref:WXG100 family type VII secretion target n=1 Tax=Nocardia sp. NPDC058176 TaxID=3346368 RepID=UPI0036DB1C10